MIDISAWGWPQITYLVLMALSLGVHLAKHGQPAPQYNILRSLLAISIVLTVLTFGGFFK